MTRLVRVVIPHLPHHVTHRGYGRAKTFFSDDDYRFYLDLLRKHCAAAEVSIWVWVLMPNHLILTPQDADGIRRALSKVHRTYTGHIHARMQRTGHFWQGRFGCVPMDETHLAAALRYVALNPVRARLAKRAVDWRWSSVHDQLSRKRRGTLTDTAPVRERYPDFAALIEAGEDEALSMALRRAATIGRLLGDAAFVKTLERQTGRVLRPAKRGPKPQQAPELER